MLGLPKSTEVNSRISKERLYANASVTPQIRVIMQEHIESVIWRNKIAESTMAVSRGDDIEEIQVFEIQLRQRGFNKLVLSAIAKAIPYKIVFVLVFGEEVQAWIDAAGTFYGTDWQPIDVFALKFEGLNLDTVYENLARQISDGRLEMDGSIEDAVELDKRRQKMESEIAALEKKLLREKQFNKQVEFSNKLKQLRKELEE